MADNVIYHYPALTKTAVAKHFHHSSCTHTEDELACLISGRQDLLRLIRFVIFSVLP